MSEFTKNYPIHYTFHRKINFNPLYAIPIKMKSSMLEILQNND